MRTNTRMKILVLAFVALAALLLLSAGLTGMELAPGEPFPLWGNLARTPENQGFQNIPGGNGVLLLFRAIYLLALIGTPLMLVYLLISPERRRELFKIMIRLGPIILIIYLFSRLAAAFTNRENQVLGPGGGANREPPYPIEPARFVFNPPPWLALLVSLALAGILAAVILFAISRLWLGRGEELPLARLAQEAQQALDDIQGGADLKNAVIRCYFEMSRVLSAQRGIRRDRAMTPREFELALESQGLPGEPVRRLTRLFEEARYGRRIPGSLDERQALDSLQAIVEACRQSEKVGTA